MFNIDGSCEKHIVEAKAVLKASLKLPKIEIPEHAIRKQTKGE